MRIAVTGAVGFIASALIHRLNDAGHRHLILADDFSGPRQRRNLEGKTFDLCIDRDLFPAWLAQPDHQVDLLFHLGARTDTAERDEALLDRLNLSYSKRLWEICTARRIPLIYASSAATYGAGDQGYADRHELIPTLRPLNPYGWSKQRFDLWVLQQQQTPPRWAGVKFFNVYGPNEGHKGRMASVVYHTFREVRRSGRMRLFRSHRDDVPHGHQKRDFIYVKDVTAVLIFMMSDRFEASGIYNLGTGRARTFLDLARTTFEAMERPPRIDFIDTPAQFRDTYQYFTQAEMDKLRAAGYEAPFYSLEEGIHDYVRHYLLAGRSL